MFQFFVNSNLSDQVLKHLLVILRRSPLQIMDFNGDVFIGHNIDTRINLPKASTAQKVQRLVLIFQQRPSLFGKDALLAFHPSSQLLFVIIHLFLSNSQLICQFLQIAFEEL